MHVALDRDGHFIAPDVVGPERVAALTGALEGAGMARSERGGETFGGRNLLNVPEVQDVLVLPAIRQLVISIVGNRFRAVRGLFFDKTAQANWPVPWHQDLTVALTARADVDGWSAWSVKAGTVHAQPPAHVLEQVLTMRLHLDDCGQDNGPLRVRSGTHRFGRLSRAHIDAFRETIPETTCIAKAGSALFMRPLLLHASSAAKRPGHRRVLHVEFAPEDVLPSQLTWAA